MTKITSQGSGSFAKHESWGLNEYATPLVIADGGSQIGDITLSVVRSEDTDLLEGDDITIDNDLLGIAVGRVHTVGMTGPSQASVTADSALHRFLSGRRLLPGIESGLPAAALDVLTQISGTKRQTGPNASDRYWSLQGHSVGFDASGAMVEPSSTTKVLNNSGVLITPGAIKAEQVLYEDISGFCSVTDFAAGGYPRFVLGDTLPTSQTAVAYLKFTVLPSTSDATTEFSVNFGPSTRSFAGTGLFTNNTRVRVTLATAAAGGTINTTIDYQNSTGGAASATAGNSTSQAYIARSKAITVVIRFYIIGSTMSVTFQAASDSGATTAFEATATLSGAAARLFSKQWSITQSSNGGGVKDLVTRSTGTDVDEWDDFVGITYATAPGFTNELASAHGGSPIAAFDGEMWDYLKQICSARSVEVAAIGDQITLREPAIRTLSLSRRASAARAVTSAIAARNVTIVNHNTRVLARTTDEAWRPSTVYSVAVGETKTLTFTLPEGIRFLWSPRPWRNGLAVNAVQVLSIADDYAALEAGAVGLYYITAADGFPVNPSQWTQYGGRVSARIVNGKGELTLTGPTKEIPGVGGPFKIGESAGSTDYAVLRVMGVGVHSNPVEVVLPSGADHARTRVESSSTITNVAIGSAVDLYDAAAWAAQRTAGPRVTLTATVPADSAGQFGYLTGGLIEHEGSIFRVDSARVGGGVVTVEAQKYTRLSDFPSPSRTLDDFAADVESLICHDFSIKPLTF